MSKILVTIIWFISVWWLSQVAMTTVVHQECEYEDDKLSGQHPVRYWWRLKANRKNQSDPGWERGKGHCRHVFPNLTWNFQFILVINPLSTKIHIWIFPDWSNSLKNYLREYDKRFKHLSAQVAQARNIWASTSIGIVA